MYLWLRLQRLAWWFGSYFVGLFAWLLAPHLQLGAGRIYAAYGGLYVVAFLVWLWAVEGIRPDQWDLIGVSVCLIGAAIILFAARG